tara:strand:+ start:150 stop:374 length:225 start_codon:yes stop_codon:yes gene_type:complete
MALQTQTAKEFHVKIESIVKDTSMSYMDAVLYYCESNKMEPETAGSLINGKLKQKIREEAEELNFLPKTARLPV